MKIILLVCTVTLRLVAVGQSFQFQEIGGAKPFKRGKSYELNWTSELPPDHQLTFELSMGDVKVLDWTGIPDSGRHSFTLPTSLKPGKNYQFKVLDGDRLLSRSSTFGIKRKIPLALKFTPVVVAGVLIATLPKEEKPDVPQFIPPGGS